MRLIALMPVRNEDWVVGLSARAALAWCDSLVVLNHASTDGTQQILDEVSAEYPGRVTVLNEPDPVWHEMAHRQRLLDTARSQGATHCALVDADEVLTGNLLPSIRGIAESLRSAEIAMIPWLCMWRSPFKVRTDPNSRFARALKAVVFCDAPGLCYQTDAGYDHHHTHPYGSILREERVPGGLMHLQFADWPRIVAKHALYKMSETVRWPGRRTAAQLNELYDPTLAEVGLATSQAPFEWWEPYEHLMGKLRFGEEPWQAAECRLLLAEHGASKFAGLDLYN